MKLTVISFLICAYNDYSRHSTTLLKPNYLLFGVEFNLTVDTIVKNFDEAPNTKDKSIGEYIAEIRANWKNAVDYSKFLTKNMHDKISSLTDKDKVESTFEMGALST